MYPLATGGCIISVISYLSYLKTNKTKGGSRGKRIIKKNLYKVYVCSEKIFFKLKKYFLDQFIKA